MSLGVLHRLPASVQRPLRRYLVQRLSHPMDPGGFFVCYSHRFMFVPISKNASTSLKQLVYRLDVDPEGAPVDGVHEHFGYVFDGHHRISLAQARARRFDGFLRFAVWRDPVARLCSYYDNQVAPWRNRSSGYLRQVGMLDADFGTFLRFVQRELRKKDILSQDQHIRRASDSYQPDAVDVIVPLGLLGDFLRVHLGLNPGHERANRAERRVTPTVAQRATIRRLYRPDYRLLSDRKLRGLC